MRPSVMMTVLVSGWLVGAAAAEDGYRTVKDVLYRADDGGLTAYEKERCRLDVYHPVGKDGFATVVWFHGGGLKGGNKSVPAGLKGKGIAVVAANYRLHPKVEAPVYIEDAAAAVAWTLKHIAEYGGSPDKVVVSGHSAGGYLTSMVGFDPKYLGAFGEKPDGLAGLAPYSGHTITHMTVRAERGIGDKQPVVDAMAPLWHVRKDTPPVLLMTGDRELEMLGRYEENAYFYRMLKVVGHPDVTLLEFDSYGHGMAEPGHPMLLKFVKRVCGGGASGAGE